MPPELACGILYELKEVLPLALRGRDREYTKELDNAVAAVKASEEWRREYMTLFLRDRENVRLGGYITKVGLIRHNMGSQTLDSIASFIALPADICNEVVRLIKSHPDWDDEQVAEEIEWE